MKIDATWEAMRSLFPAQNKNVESKLSEMSQPSFTVPQAEELFSKYGKIPTKEDVEHVNRFLDQDVPQKLNVLDIALYKEITPTKENLDAIYASTQEIPELGEQLVEVELTTEETHDLLSHLKLPEPQRSQVMVKMKEGVPLVKALQEVAGVKGETRVATLIRYIQQSTDGKVFTTIAQEAAIPFNGDFFAQSLTDHTSSLFTGVLDETLVDQSPTIADMITPPSTLQSALQSMPQEKNRSTLVSQESSFEQSPKGLISPVSPTDKKQSVEEVRHVLTNDSEELSNRLSTKTDELAMMPSQNDLTSIPEIMTPDVVLAMVQEVITHHLNDVVDQIDVKTYLVSYTNAVTTRAANEFKTFQQEMQQILPTVSSEERLDRAIETLSKALNKSSFAMFSDMALEKKLLLAGASLEKARAWIKSNQQTEARKIIASVQKLIAEVTFEPTIRKVKAFVNQQADHVARALKQDQISVEQYRQNQHQLFSDASVRDQLERIRLTGTNHEVEVYEESTPFTHVKNIKEILLRIQRQHSDPAVESYLQTMNGQQMMNDSNDRKKGFYMFNVPIEVEGEVEGMKVYLQGSSRNNTLDWKNAQLYFGLQLKEKGALGIQVSSINGQLKVQVLSDQLPWAKKTFQEITAPLSALGFESVTVQYLPYKEQKITPPNASSISLNDQIEGLSSQFDMKI